MAQRHTRPTLLEASIPESLELGDRYEYRDRDRVQAYLAARPYLVDILREADAQIAHRFGENTKVILAVEDDVDQVGVASLWGYIRTPLPARDARDILSRFDREWWITRSWDVREELALDVRAG